MEFYVDDCNEYSVRPTLGVTCASDEVPACFPCLPRCTKPIHYCCEKPKPKAPPRTPAYCDLREHEHGRRTPRDRSPRRQEHRGREPCYSPPRRCESCCPPPRCESYCPPPCKPVKTKYVIPCYRYEDGRIANQPTLLMRRACEVAVGTRPRRKPFVHSCFVADPEQLEHRYVSEDDRGNCLYHFEKKKHSEGSHPCIERSRGPHHLYGPCHSSPECQHYGHCGHYGHYVNALPMPLASAYGSVLPFY